MLIQLKDGGITNISSSYDVYQGGCPTCDYGTTYSLDYYINLSNNKAIHLDGNSDYYEFPLSDEFMLKLFLNNLEYIKTLTIEEFIDWLRDQIKDEDVILEITDSL